MEGGRGRGKKGELEVREGGRRKEEEVGRKGGRWR